MAQQTQEIFVTGRSASRRITYTFTLRLTENTADPVAATLLQLQITGDKK